MQKRESGRLKETPNRKQLDEVARRRRQRKALDALEEDNFQSDPHADLKMSKKAPKFEESTETTGTPKVKKKKGKFDHQRLKVKKTLAILLEEEQALGGPFNYLNASVPPSSFPERKFCSVCGFPSPYSCLQCGSRYCSVKCLNTHQDTRCLKWIA